MYYYNNELIHYGVKGMKWGVRRFQNYDGTYTQKGLSRYKQAESDYDRKASAAARAKASGNRASYKIAKKNLRASKKNLNRSYKKLVDSYNADEGKKLYDKGLTSKKAKRRYAAGLAGVTIGGAAVSIGGAKLCQKILEDSGSSALASVTARTIGLGGTLVAAMLGQKFGRELTQTTAYDRHRGVGETKSSRNSSTGNRRPASSRRSPSSKKKDIPVTLLDSPFDEKGRRRKNIRVNF